MKKIWNLANILEGLFLSLSTQINFCLQQGIFIWIVVYRMCFQIRYINVLPFVFFPLSTVGFEPRLEQFH